MNKRKICAVIVDRANYGRLKPVLQSLKDHPEIDLQIVASGTTVLERFGYTVKSFEDDGFKINGKVYMELEGSTPATMSKSVGLGIMEFSNEFQRLNPEIVLIIGDRYEALSACIAAAYMNICLAHIQGGEVSGSIDESARHAISKFAHYHFPSTNRAAKFLEQMGERPETILQIGCPSSDIARTLDQNLAPDAINHLGSGAELDLSRGFVLVLFHPTTTEFGGSKKQMEALLASIEKLHSQVVILWPNIDAGSDHVSKCIRQFKDANRHKAVRYLTNLEPEFYLKVLANTTCAVGNSSSFVRDAGYFGTPVVLVGNRQYGREWSEHVTQVAPDSSRISEAIDYQFEHGRYAKSDLYGDGHVSPRIAQSLASVKLYIQKTLGYVSLKDKVE